MHHESRKGTAVTRESDLYDPIKRYIEAAGYHARGEVGPCDIVGVRDGCVIAVEMKLTFGLPVLYQALRRLPGVDLVYVAVAVPDGRKARHNWDRNAREAVRLCRMLGVGLLSVRDGEVVAHADPAPYQPRKQPKQRAKLLSEFQRRTGDHNVGGTNRCPRITAYREEALACANALAVNGPMKASAVRDATGVPRASRILHADVYGWFVKVARGVYDIRQDGRSALERHAGVLALHGKRLRA